MATQSIIHYALLFFIICIPIHFYAKQPKANHTPKKDMLLFRSKEPYLFTKKCFSSLWPLTKISAGLASIDGTLLSWLKTKNPSDLAQKISVIFAQNVPIDIRIHLSHYYFIALITGPVCIISGLKDLKNIWWNNTNAKSIPTTNVPINTRELALISTGQNEKTMQRYFKIEF